MVLATNLLFIRRAKDSIDIHSIFFLEQENWHVGVRVRKVEANPVLKTTQHGQFFEWSLFGNERRGAFIGCKGWGDGKMIFEAQANLEGPLPYLTLWALIDEEE